MRKHLYRFISFEDFINLVINNKDKFVRPSVWDDGYEGYLFSSLDSPEDVRHIVSEMFNNLCPRNYYAIPDNYFRMWHSKCFTYAQCWSEHRETDAMWRCYSYGNRAIRIRSRADKLLAHVKSIFQENSGFTVYLRKVSYDLNKRSNIEQQIAQMGDSKLTHETYFHKRPAFKHEKEVRLLIADTSLYIRENLSSLGVKWNIAEQVMGKNDEEIIEYLTERILSHRIDYKLSSNANVWVEDAGNISDFLEGVMVHPSAPEWYVNIVQDICLQKGIHFDGQSQIYKLK